MLLKKLLSKLSAGSDWLRMGSGHVVSDDHVINSLFAWACGIVGVRGSVIRDSADGGEGEVGSKVRGVYGTA